jgi:hypothetical protein
MAIFALNPLVNNILIKILFNILNILSNYKNLSKMPKFISCVQNNNSNSLNIMHRFNNPILLNITITKQLKINIKNYLMHINLLVPSLLIRNLFITNMHSLLKKYHSLKIKKNLMLINFEVFFLFFTIQSTIIFFIG